MAKQLLITAALVGMAIVAVVLSGRSGGADGGSLAIHRLDLRSVEVPANTYAPNPPTPANDYPAVVATVNGLPIAGDDLAKRQLTLELARRTANGEVEANVYPDELRDALVAKYAAEDPLETIIDAELERQAVIRIGLLPSQEEAVAYARDLQRLWEDAIEVAPPDQQEEMRRTEATLWPSRDWSADAAYVERLREPMGLTELKKQECRWYFETLVPLNGTGGHDCSAFLQQERARADIVYYVRWAD